MSSFVKTDTILDRILTHKQGEIASAKAAVPMAALQAQIASMPPAQAVIPKLRQETVTLIAEVKHASPSRGVLIAPFEPVKLAQAYEANGAAMLSVLTDEKFFQGGLDVLQRVREAVSLPLLRKEFVIDPYQVVEARAAGADAVLLIVMALADAQLAELHIAILEQGMTPLVEVHSLPELERAMRVDPALIGVNNRDLKTFDVDIETVGRVAAEVPPSVTLVAESGLKTPQDVAHMGELGAHAVLIGEGLVTADDIPATVRAFSQQARPV